MHFCLDMVCPSPLPLESCFMSRAEHTIACKYLWSCCLQQQIAAAKLAFTEP